MNKLISLDSPLSLKSTFLLVMLVLELLTDPRHEWLLEQDLGSCAPWFLLLWDLECTLLIVISYFGTLD